MKKLLDKWISISLIKRIIGGLALGIILGRGHGRLGIAKNRII